MAGAGSKGEWESQRIIFTRRGVTREVLTAVKSSGATVVTFAQIVKDLAALEGASGAL